MQSERDIHENAGQHASPDAKAVPKDNVDFFETPPAGGPPAPALERVSPIGDAEHPAAALVAAPAKVSELGENVDLF
jgi:hypothetical protein